MTKWNHRFLELAKHVSTWSKDSTKVGAVIVDPTTKQVVGMGYNGFPRGIDDAPARYSHKETKLKLVCHAELNAILNANRSVRGCEIYVYPTMMEPACCPDCSKAIVQSGLTRVYGYNGHDLSARWQELAEYSKIILSEGGVSYISVKNNIDTTNEDLGE